MTTEQKLADAITGVDRIATIIRNRFDQYDPHSFQADEAARAVIEALAESSGVEDGPRPQSELPWRVSAGDAPYAHDRYLEQPNGEAVPVRPPSDVGALNARAIAHRVNTWPTLRATIGALRSRVSDLERRLHEDTIRNDRAEKAEATRDSLYDALDFAYRRHDAELKLLDPNGERVAEVMRLRQTADQAEDKAFPAWARDPKVRAAVEAFLAMPASERAAHIKLTFAPVYPILMALHVALLPSPEEARDGQE